MILTHDKVIPGAEVDKDQRFLMHNLRRWSIRIALALIALALIYMFVHWLRTPSHTNTAVRQQTASSQRYQAPRGCDQVLTQPFTVGAAPVPVTDGSRCYTILDVLQGEVRVEGPGGYIDVGPNGILRQHIAPGWHGMRMHALTGAVVRQRNCPQGTTRWNGQQCI